MQRTVTASALFQEGSTLEMRGWRRVTGMGIFITLLALVVALSSPWRGADAWSSTILESVVFAAGVVWAIEHLFRNFPPVKSLALLLPLFALVAFAVIQTLPLGAGKVDPEAGSATWRTISADPDATQRFARRLSAIALALTLLLRYTTTRSRYIALVCSVIAAGLAASIIVLVYRFQHVSGSPSIYVQYQNQNEFAFLMCMVIGLTLGIVLKGGLSWWVRIVGLAVVVAPWIALVLTRSRGGLLALGSQLLFLIFMSCFVRSTSQQRARLFRTTFSTVGLVVCLAAAILVSVFWIGGNQLIQRLETVPVEFSLDGRTGGNRLDIWRATWRAAVANPIVGTGLGAFQTSITKYHDASGKWVPQQAHNEYLELLAGAGLIGGLIALGFLYVFIKAVRKGLLAEDRFQAAATLGATTGIFAVAVHSFFDFGLHVIANALMFITLISIATISVTKEHKSISH